jgi:hypothetical protein
MFEMSAACRTGVHVSCSCCTVVFVARVSCWMIYIATVPESSAAVLALLCTHAQLGHCTLQTGAAPSGCCAEVHVRCSS